MQALNIKFYKQVSISLGLIFAIVGMIFLVMPRSVLIFFNSLSRQLGMDQAPVVGINFYLILAVAYMYIVTLLSWMMALHPKNSILPFLLVHAKIASSILSFCLFTFHHPYLIFLTNGLVDGFIGVFVLCLYFRIKKLQSAQ